MRRKKGGGTNDLEHPKRQFSKVNLLRNDAPVEIFLMYFNLRELSGAA